MKLKHNKRRNTAFLFEALIREMTKSVIEKNLHKKQQIISIIKESFGRNTLLKKELETYRSILDAQLAFSNFTQRYYL